MAAVHNADTSVSYQLVLGEESVSMNAYLGQSIRLTFTGLINCIHCGRKTKKSFAQGYCFPCMQTLAQCDQCIMSPERCHFDAGTCREPDWAEKHCMTDHIVYLSNTTAAKVGLTRETQIPTRWIDQGAEQALPIMRVKTRQQAGFIEDALRQHVPDKTNWRNMLKASAEPINLAALRDELFASCEQQIAAIQTRFGQENFSQLPDQPVVAIQFPVQKHPVKVSSLNMDKNPIVEGVLEGIKGQYLIFDTGVINLRKYTGYQISFEAL